MIVRHAIQAKNAIHKVQAMKYQSMAKIDLTTVGTLVGDSFDFEMYWVTDRRPKLSL